MELPSLDKQCSAQDCNQLDFLPLHCKCGKTLCSHHFNAHVQACEKSRFLTEDELKKIGNIFLCSYNGCTEGSIIPLLCERCNKHFCVKHRHLQECEEKSHVALAAEKEKYAAPLRQFREAKACVDKQLDSKLVEVKTKGKHKDMAHKIQLMRIKNRATGIKSVPIPDRIYFNVIFLKEGNEKATAVFVSKQWSLGRAIDAIAQELKLENNNNKRNEKKLRLFKKDTKEIVSNKMSTGLQILLQDDILINGEDLVIEYIENDCD
ncbi:hypothetical protein NQ315_012530 [Exocentrus adspersus]|uniref:ZFAND1-like ubiquitin-like domain-containing protein n=1 Tax=Exocentrus adspersus TaxID=1586481 RepID=A0AAV8VC84_9CUCU|nr:hypothetical protein NQ315_012530 [Exocentrus adspersus]